MNPYEPPPSVEEPRLSRLSRLLQLWRGQRMALEVDADPSLLEFLRGARVVYYGVVFFVDPEDRDTLHVAIPLHESNAANLADCVDEVLRLLPLFLADFPDLHSSLNHRRCIVRLIRSYRDLHTEFGERIELPAVITHHRCPVSGSGVQLGECPDFLLE